MERYPNFTKYQEGVTCELPVVVLRSRALDLDQIYFYVRIVSKYSAEP